MPVLMARPTILEYKSVPCNKLLNGNDRSSKIRSSAICASTASLDKNLSIGENTVIAQSSRMAKGSKVGRDSYLSRNVRLNPGVTIGDGVCIEAGTIVSKNIRIGNDYVVFPTQFEPFDLIKAENGMTYEMIDGHCMEVKK